MRLLNVKTFQEKERSGRNELAMLVPSQPNPSVSAGHSDLLKRPEFEARSEAKILLLVKVGSTSLPKSDF